MRLVRIASRQSDLARLQAYLVGQALQKNFPDLEIQFQFRESLGDQNQHDPLWKMPQKGVFTEDFLQDLRDEKADLVVHSWKDLPTENRPDTEVVATLQRADQRDFLLLKPSARGHSQLRILSSSPRRAHNLSDFLPAVMPWVCKTVEFANIRGNIPTRIRKWLESDADGLILAKAAIDRLLASESLAQAEEFRPVRELLKTVLAEQLWMVLPLSINPNAAAQGALALEIKKGRTDVRKLLESLNVSADFTAVQAERQRLSQLGGGCHQKIGVAVLARANGEVYWERGRTEAGVDLAHSEWRNSHKPPQFTATQLWSLPETAQSQIVRSEVSAELNLPSENCGVWVARASAWPKRIQPAPKLVWTAGLQTWRSLAERGVWVQGCSEGLGENEDTRVQNLVAISEWVKLTHSDRGGDSTLATYKLDLSRVDWKIQSQHQFFYWRSGSQFRSALAAAPQIRALWHASGPGLTHQTLVKELGDQKVFVFLHEEDWRTQCQLDPTPLKPV